MEIDDEPFRALLRARAGLLTDSLVEGEVCGLS